MRHCDSVPSSFKTEAFESWLEFAIGAGALDGETGQVPTEMILKVEPEDH
jgi:hypothetical protein